MSEIRDENGKWVKLPEMGADRFAKDTEHALAELDAILVSIEMPEEQRKVILKLVADFDSGLLKMDDPDD